MNTNYIDYADALEALKISNKSFEDTKKEALLRAKAIGLTIGGLLAISGGFVAINSIVDKFGKVKDNKKFNQATKAIIEDTQSNNDKKMIVTDALKCNENAASELRNLTASIINKINKKYQNQKFIKIHSINDYSNKSFVPSTSVNDLVVNFLKCYDKSNGTLRPITDEKSPWNYYIIAADYSHQYIEYKGFFEEDVVKDDETGESLSYQEVYDYFHKKIPMIINAELKHTKYLKNMIGNLESIDLKDGSYAYGFSVYPFDKSNNKVMQLFKSYVK